MTLHSALDACPKSSYDCLVTSDAHRIGTVDQVHASTDHAAVIVKIPAHLVPIPGWDKRVYGKPALSRQEPGLKYEFIRSETIRYLLRSAGLVRRDSFLVF